MYFLLACVLTVFLEGVFFFVLGYRNIWEQSVIACANVITNLLLNLVLSISAIPREPFIYVLESMAVITEYLIYRRAFSPSRNLFMLTLAANIISYGIGLILF